MGANIDTIDSTLFAALQALTKITNLSNKFIGVYRWVGKARSINDLPLETLGKTPALILNLDRDTIIRDADTLNQGVIETTSTTTWFVWVVVSDVRDGQQIAKNVPGGLYSLASLVRSLSGLLVPDPPATLRFAITGTPNATVTFGNAQLKHQNSVYYKPLTPSVVLNGAGNGFVNAQCVTVGSLGNLPDGANAVWSETVVSLNSNATVDSTITDGLSGLKEDEQVIYEGCEFEHGVGIVGARLTFSARSAVDQFDFTADLTGLPLTSISLDMNLGDRDSEAFPNPLLQVSADTTE